ncbi:RHS repeat-associated core domain-containing protein [Erwinia sorbitola]|nr:RHS repeat-associated core domain-containing protein [Erwinia sorbitola]
MTLTTGQEAGGYGVRQDTRWEYDGADRVLARYAEGREEAFRWDASGNLLNGGAVAWNDQVSRAGDYRHEWDEFGRLARRISVKDSAVQHLHYDGDGRVTSVTFSGHPRYREVCYDYDGLGRRTAKTVKHVSPYEPDKRTDFYWQGMRLSAEQGTHEALTFHFYHGESHTPLARYDSGEGGMRYVHAEVNGMPQALSDREGNTVWRPLHTGLFGVIRREESRLSPYAARQNLRFAGQYYDEETGLHYNTLRYYDPGSGSFTQPDPIGLAGGINLYSYAPNPLTWIDPLGLANRPNNGIYKIFFEHTVNASNRYSSDAVQFKRANDALIKRLNTDAAFRRDMFNRHPELSNWMKNGSKSSSPAGFTWHHHEDLDRLVLVDRLDHKSNHALYHPTGNGGRDIWGGGDPGRKGKLDGATGKAC